MKVTADTSVVVAAFASWHEHHALATAAIARVNLVVAHCLLETYSVLTRLRAPHRMDAQVVATYLRAAFGSQRAVILAASDHRKLVDRCAAEHISGGAVYDAVIALTAARSGAKLLTLDGRARATYSSLGVEHELLA